MLDFDDVDHDATAAFARELAKRWNAHEALVSALLESVADCTHPCDECPEQDGCLTPKALAVVFEGPTSQ